MLPKLQPFLPRGLMAPPDDTWQHARSPPYVQARPRRSSRYSSAWDCAVQSVREEGPGVFAKGLGATLGRAFIVNAAIFTCFEACMSAMDGAPVG